MKKNENITIRTGENLRKWALEAKEYNKRDLYNDVMRFIYDRQSIKVLALCGLRRTGKTTILRQAALTLLEDNKKVAVIDFTASQDAMDFRTVLSGLRDDGYDYVFIDEATASPDFINISSVLSDDYAASGMKLVLSGTDSLSFVLASKNELYDRCIILKTSYIPYREFERVLGISGVDKYIEYGGTMCMEGTKYHKDVYSPFIDRAATNQYIDSAIAYNIQHSLDYFHDGEFYGRLHTLRARGELTNVINRVVEDKNRELVAYVIDRTYKSRDLGSTVQLAAKHEDYPGGDELRQIDRDAINTALKNALDIRNIEERSIGVTEEHLNDIKRYLQDLGILHEYTVSTYDIHEVWSESIINVIAQPGMRYSQSKTFVELLLKIINANMVINTPQTIRIVGISK